MDVACWVITLAILQASTVGFGFCIQGSEVGDNSFFGDFARIFVEGRNRDHIGVRG